VLEPSEADLLGSDQAIGYGPRPLPDPLDEKIRHLIEARERAGRLPDLAGALSLRQARVLLAFAERMASLAVRSADPAVLRQGLLAWSVGAPAEDPRDAVLILPLLWSAAEKLRLDPAAEFRAAAGRAPASSPGLESFASRSPENRRIEAMGYVESADAGGFRYQRTW